MKNSSEFDDMLALSMHLQRQLWETWIGGAMRGSNGSPNDGLGRIFERGEEMLRACLKLQADLACAAMRPWCGGANERSGMDAARDGMEAWLAFQASLGDTWLAALRTGGPARSLPDYRPIGTASEWIDAIGKLTEQGFEMQRRFIGAMPSGTQPGSRKAAGAKAAERHAA